MTGQREPNDSNPRRHERRDDDDAESEVDTEEVLNRVSSLRFREQAIWFLNALPASSSSSLVVANDENVEVNSRGPIETMDEDDECELVWMAHKKCEELCDKGVEGTRLDEFGAHRLLEYAGGAQTRLEMRDALCVALGGDAPVGYGGGVRGNRATVSLVEVLLLRFGADWAVLASAPQAYDWRAEREAREGMAEAESALEGALAAAAKSAEDAEVARVAGERAEEERSKSAEAMERSRAAGEAFADAKEQANQSLDALHEREAEISTLRAKLERLSTDNTAGIVKRNKAKAELVMLDRADPTPLRSAKLRQEAAVKKLTRATKHSRRAAEEAQSSMEKARKAKEEANRARTEAESAMEAAEKAIPTAREAFESVRRALDDATKRRAAGRGTLFYIRRELKEAEMFLPKTKYMEMKQKAKRAMEEAIPPGD